MQDFRSIEAWQLNRQLVVAIYRATRCWPPDERFCLTNQIRKSVTSIGANIAEAFGRYTRTDTARVLQNSVSEGNETLHHLITALDLGYLPDEEFELLSSRLEVIHYKVVNLIGSIRPRRKRAPKRGSGGKAPGSWPRTK